MMSRRTSSRVSLSDSVLDAEVILTFENGMVSGQGVASDYGNAVLEVGDSTPIVVKEATCG
jgi:hypothetical protein